MRLTIITVSSIAVKFLVDIHEEIRAVDKNALDLRINYIGRSLCNINCEKIEKDILDADITLIDLMGAPREVWDLTAEVSKRAKGNIVPIGDRNKDIQEAMKLGQISGKQMSAMSKSDKPMNKEKMTKMMNMAEKVGKMMPIGKARDMKNLSYISKYWTNGKKEDMRNLLYLLMRDYGNIKSFPKAKEPQKIDDIAICDPSTMKYFKNYEEYKKIVGFDSEKPTIAVLYYAHNYPTCTSEAVGKIVCQLKEFANILPIATCSATPQNLEQLKKYMNVEEPSLILNFRSFRLAAGPMGGEAEEGVEILNDINVPIFHPILITRRKEEEWRESLQGMASSEFLVSVMLPELDGDIEIFPVGATKLEKTVEEHDGLEIVSLDIIEERVDKLIGKIKNWINLRKKPNKEKKVAIVCYNYPPGEGNLFGGAFLDTFKSVEKIIKELKENEYNTDAITSKELMDRFLTGGIVNSGRWTSEDELEKLIHYDTEEYNSWLNNNKYKNEIIEQWGKVPGEIMSNNEKFLIPGIRNKNVFIGLQPTRGVHENPEKAYHDKELMPHHQYIAFYKWIRDEFKADAVIHVGTHGTIEFLKGKECGMSGDCFPDMLLSDLPHLYLYYSGNPSEGMIAKRRSHAVITSYQPPMFMEGELYGDFVKLESLINEYEEAKKLQPQRCNIILENIKTQAHELNFNYDDIHDIEKELYRMKRSLVPSGLHIFGESYKEEESREYTKFILRYDRGEVKALRRILAECKGIDYEHILKNYNTEKLSELDIEAGQTIDKFIQHKNIDFMNIKNKAVEKELLKTLQFGIESYRNSMKCFEIDGLLKLLNGEYLQAKLAGDMVRNPEVLPTGYNIYQFDPRYIPSESAVEKGRQIAENTISQYFREHGEYPKSTAVILWGLETSRTQGETIGQILSYLGVKVNSDKRDFKLKYEIIPTEELGRPRIDVVVNICGFFRDMFPNMMEDLNDIFKRVAELEEDDEVNFMKYNSKKLFNYLVEEGYCKEEAEELSYARVFGPAESQYGTNVTSLIETKNWETEEQIGEQYVKSLNHVYTKSFRGKEMKELFNKNLSVVDIVSQIRSNHEYEITDLDHYYEFFGGLAKSVEMAKGKKSEVYITDTTAEQVETESVEKSINRGVRTRVLNPKWIDSMLEHDYHGVQKISDIFENIMGLSATTNRVEQWVYSDLYKTYVENEDLRERVIQNNKWAYFNMLETMMEYEKRGYWEASQEQLKNIRKQYLELEGDIEENQDKDY